MVNLQNIHSLTEFKRNANSYIETIRSTKAPIGLTVNGEDAVVIEDAIAYQEKLDRLNAFQEEVNELKLEWLRKELEVGLKDLREGRFKTYTVDTLDELFEEIITEGRAKLELEAELDRRQAAYEANPEPLLTWEEVQANILAKYS